MDKVKILWADDEIDLLKPHVLFLEQKGYEVVTAKSGDEAYDQVQDNYFDVVFLDENMPGLSGLDALQAIKRVKKNLPVVMITKSEEEHIMEEAIGSEISDYLIKPVNPNQILLSLKKILDNRRLVSEKSTSSYQQEFREIGMELSNHLDFEEWVTLYKKLVYWDLKLSESTDTGMMEILNMQKTEANNLFARFVEDNYIYWLNNPFEEDVPVLSHTLFKKAILPHLDGPDPVYVFVVDCLRYDQWKTIQAEISRYFKLLDDDCYCSILPTATQYARNAIFAGLMPSEIERKFGDKWLNDEDEGGKNQFEKDFLADQLKRCNKADIKWSYDKVITLQQGKKFADNIHQTINNKLNVVVYNFVDALSHARTDTKIIRELAEDEKAYRSLTKSWFEHSPLLEGLKKIAEKKAKIIITTDHGAVHVQEASKVVGDKDVNTNLRYKQGKRLEYNPKEVFEIKDPSEAFLPRQHVSSRFIFAKEDRFFAYPNNYNHYVKYYRDTFQHGGISLEEMVVPIVVMESK